MTINITAGTADDARIEFAFAETPSALPTAEAYADDTKLGDATVSAVTGTNIYEATYTVPALTASGTRVYFRINYEIASVAQPTVPLFVGVVDQFGALFEAIKAYGDNEWGTATGFAVAGDAMALTIGERTTLAGVVDSTLLDAGDATDLIASIVSRIGNTNVDEASLVGLIRADIERSGGILKLLSDRTTEARLAKLDRDLAEAGDEMALTSAADTSIAARVRTELTPELDLIDVAISSLAEEGDEMDLTDAVQAELADAIVASIQGATSSTPSDSEAVATNAYRQWPGALIGEDLDESLEYASDWSIEFLDVGAAPVGEKVYFTIKTDPDTVDDDNATIQVEYDVDSTVTTLVTVNGVANGATDKATVTYSDYVVDSVTYKKATIYLPDDITADVAAGTYTRDLKRVGLSGQLGRKVFNVVSPVTRTYE